MTLIDWLITEPTQIWETLIDHILVSNPSGFIKSSCLDVGISDHLMMYTVTLGELCHGYKIRMVQAFNPNPNPNQCNIGGL